MKSYKIGISDIPTGHNDQLGFDKKASSLAHFVEYCDTPMTIGIQGGWGTGKTSLMKMIQTRLSEKCVKVEINTWQYAQVVADDKLPLWIIAGLARKLAEKSPEGQKIMEAFGWPNILGLARGLVSKHLGVDEEKTMTQNERIGLIDGSAVAEEIRNTFTKLAENLTGSDGRIVFFIDDIDRIRPEAAVSLLEGIKNFIDVEGCVFVLAVDFEVIQRGLGAREGGEGRDFFEKIIQVPYSLRPQVYTSETYVMGHLKTMGGLDDLEYDSAKLKSFIAVTTRHNPRTIKRALNLYSLHCEMVRWEGGEGAPATLHHAQRMLVFALACMQVSSEYRPVFERLMHTPCPEVTIISLAQDDGNELEEAEILDRIVGYDSGSMAEALQVSEDIISTVCGQEDDGESSDTKARKRLKTVASYVYRWIDRNGDQKISNDEANHLRAVLEMSAATTLGDESEGDQNEGDQTAPTRAARTSFEDLRRGGWVSGNMKLYFCHPARPDERNKFVYPMFEGINHYVLRDWGGKPVNKSKKTSLAIYTNRLLSKAAQTPTTQTPTKYWIIEDPGSKGHGKLLSEVIALFREVSVPSI